MSLCICVDRAGPAVSVWGRSWAGCVSGGGRAGLAVSVWGRSWAGCVSGGGRAGLAVSVAGVELGWLCQWRG